MYKVLLADDEELDLEGMRTFIPWEAMGLEVVGAVNNGFDAFRVIEREPIDILVTDVRMPSMSGLELARKSLERQSDLRIIFVSGHQDFEYVKEALSLNACSYVLKPMDDAELIQSLEKVKQELERDHKRRAVERAMVQMKPIVQSEYVLQLLEGSLDAAGHELMLEGQGIEPVTYPVRVAVIETDDLSWKLNPYTEAEQRKLLNDYSVLVGGLCRNERIHHMCKLSKQRTALLLDDSASQLVALRRLIGEVGAAFPFTITIGLGSEAGDAAALQDSYREALSALDYKMLDGKGKMIDATSIRPAEMENARDMEEHLEALFSAMRSYELVRIHDEIDGLFHAAARLRSRSAIHSFAMYLIVRLDSALHTVGENLFQLLDMELTNLDIVLHFETVDDIRSWLRRRVFEISELLHLKKQKKNSRLIQDIMEYVGQRLNDVTLRDVADRFSFSPNYLGHLFKEETGKNFSEYVIGLRLEQACELLQDPKLKIYEVADRIGYRYLPYFNKLFKEHYGMTPMEFRKRL